ENGTLSLRQLWLQFRTPLRLATPCSASAESSLIEAWLSRKQARCSPESEIDFHRVVSPMNGAHNGPDSRGSTERASADGKKMLKWSTSAPDSTAIVCRNQRPRIELP